MAAYFVDENRGENIKDHLTSAQLDLVLNQNFSTFFNSHPNLLIIFWGSTIKYCGRMI